MSSTRKARPPSTYSKRSSSTSSRISWRETPNNSESVRIEMGSDMEKRTASMAFRSSPGSSEARDSSTPLARAPSTGGPGGGSSWLPAAGDASSSPSSRSSIISPSPFHAFQRNTHRRVLCLGSSGALGRVFRRPKDTYLPLAPEQAKRLFYLLEVRLAPQHLIAHLLLAVCEALTWQHLRDLEYVISAVGVFHRLAHLSRLERQYGLFEGRLHGRVLVDHAELSTVAAAGGGHLIIRFGPRQLGKIGLALAHAVRGPHRLVEGLELQPVSIAFFMTRTGQEAVGNVTNPVARVAVSLLVVISQSIVVHFAHQGDRDL